MTVRVLAFVCLSGGAFVGCGGNDEAEDAQLCVGDFEASVREGPNAGTTIYGAMVVETADDGSIAATTLMLPDGSEIPVTGSVDDAGLALTVETPMGEILGLDPTTTSMASCPAEFEGDLTGPAEGDAGDWVARTTSVTSNGRTYISEFNDQGVVTSITIKDANGNVISTIQNCTNGFQTNGC